MVESKKALPKEPRMSSYYNSGPSMHNGYGGFSPPHAGPSYSPGSRQPPHHSQHHYGGGGGYQGGGRYFSGNGMMGGGSGSGAGFYDPPARSNGGYDGPAYYRSNRPHDQYDLSPMAPQPHHLRQQEADRFYNVLDAKFDHYGGERVNNHYASRFFGHDGGHPSAAMHDRGMNNNHESSSFFGSGSGGSNGNLNSGGSSSVSGGGLMSRHSLDEFPPLNNRGVGLMSF